MGGFLGGFVMSVSSVVLGGQLLRERRSLFH